MICIETGVLKIKLATIFNELIHFAFDVHKLFQWAALRESRKFPRTC